jgi:pyruvate-ferredoxin/flavodoxin oxidoreductase
VCPAKDKSNPRHKSLDMHPQRPLRDAERENFAFFLSVPEADRKIVKLDVKGSQLLRPLFEFSGACPGCGETPYVKLMTQLFGDRALIGNATGCTSIYGGNLPTTPYAVDSSGRGPAWSNSLFEDNAEFGFGLRLAVDAHQGYAKLLLQRLASQIGEQLVDALGKTGQHDEAGIEAQRSRVAELKKKLATLAPSRDVTHLLSLADYLVKKSVWLLGGDGWAYDIGYGGLDHVLASDRDVNILVLDTEVYSNTGGQASKATPIGASAKFAMAGKATAKKDLGMLAMSYGHAYVASVALGAKDQQTIKAFAEADAHPGPSLIIAYSHCIAHGFELSQGCNQQKLAVDCGAWPLYRYDPKRIPAGEPPLVLDAGAPKGSLREYMLNENRFRMVEKMDPKRFASLMEFAERHARRRTETYEQLARLVISAQGGTQAASTTSTTENE